MLKDLWKTLKGKAQQNVRFLHMSVVIAAIIFLIPITINHGVEVKNVEAGWVESAITNIADTLLGGLLKLVGKFLFFISTFILSRVAFIFKTSLEFSLSGNLFSSFDFINSGWVFIRDLINSLFIFAVLFTAMKQLLSFTGSKVNIQKTLVGLIAAALLINFSLFFTKALIDVSNFTARAIYYTMEVKNSDGAVVSYGPVEFLIKGLDIESVLNKTSEVSTGNEETSNFSQAIIYLGGTAVSVIATIIFFAMAFFFIARVVILLLLMMTSPIYFVTYVIEIKQLSSLKEQWWNQLKGQLIFPVVFMLVIYIAVLYIDAGNITGNNVTGEGIIGGSPSGFMMIVNYGIIIALMYFSLKFSKSYAGNADKFGTKMAGWTAGKSFSVGAWAGRNTAGRVGGVIANSEKMKKWATSDNKFKRLVGDKIALSGGKAMYEGSWDVRNSGYFGKAYGYANANTAKLNVGKATTKNAKNDVREFGTRSKEGLKKDAARNTAKVGKYSIIDNKISESRKRIGDNINNKEYKEYREKLITEIKTEYKDDYEKQRELITKLVGETAYKGKDYDKFREDAVKDIREKNKKKPKDQEAKVKSFLTEDVYKSEKFSKTRQEINRELKVENAKNVAGTVGEQGRKLNEKKEERATLVASGQSTADIDLVIDSMQHDLETKQQNFAAVSKDLPPSAIRELAVQDIVHLKDQLNRAHLSAINSKLIEGGYENDDDIKALDKMIEEIRFSQTISPDVKSWIDSQVMKETNGFNLNITNKLKDKLANLKTATAQNKAGIQHDIEEMVRIATKSELNNLSLEDITDDEIITQINPNIIREYSKKILSSNDTAMKNKLESIMNEVAASNKAGNLNATKRGVLVNALKGENPPKQQPQIPNTNYGRSTQPRPTVGFAAHSNSNQNTNVSATNSARTNPQRSSNP